MPEPRNAITWDDLGFGEVSSQVIQKIETGMAGALNDNKRLEVEGRAKPDGGKEEQTFVKQFDPRTTPPTPPSVILEVITSEFKTGLGDDFVGKIRINFREKGNTRNSYTSFTRSVVPGEVDDDEDDGDFDFDDEELLRMAEQHEARPTLPHIPMAAPQPPPQPQVAPGRYEEQSWRTPATHGHGLPAIDMQGSGHFGSAAYQRRRLAAREVGLTEPLSEFLMAPQWAAVTDVLGGHSDRLMRANLDYAQIVQSMFERMLGVHENLVGRLLDNNAPNPVAQAEAARTQTDHMLGVGMKLMKVLRAGDKKKKDSSSRQPPPPAWGSDARSPTEPAGDWNRPAMNIPNAVEDFTDAPDEDEFDDFDEPEEAPAPRGPRPIGPPSGGGAAAELPAAEAPRQLTQGELADSIRALARTDKEAARSLVLDVKDELAESLGVDPDLLDTFLDDDDDEDDED